MSEERRSIVDRYTGRTSASGTPTADAVPADAKDYQSSAPVSGNRPPEIMLELRLKTGNSMALGYALLLTANWNPSDGILLEFTTHHVRLIGRNLRDIYRALVFHRLAYVQELPSRNDDQPEEAAVVTSIEITSL